MYRQPNLVAWKQNLLYFPFQLVIIMLSCKSFDLGQAAIAALVSAVLVLFSPSVQAQSVSDGVLYIGGIGGTFDAERPPLRSGLMWTNEEADSAGIGRFYIGYREGANAVEFSVNTIGDYTIDCSGTSLERAGGDGIQTAERGSTSVNWLYHLGSEQLSIFPKLGLAYAEADEGDGDCSYYYSLDEEEGTKFSGFSAVYGIGMELRFGTNIAIRAEIDTGTSKLEAENYSVGAGLSVYF